MSVTHTPAPPYRTWEHAEWLDALAARFPSRRETAFRCPICGTVTSGVQLLDAGAPADAFAQECIGRYVEGAGCDYAAYGLIRIGDVVIRPDGTRVTVFPMAPAAHAPVTPVSHEEPAGQVTERP